MDNKQKQMNPYVKFTIMILTSTVVMFIMMYFNTYQWDHVYFSETRAYMALYMGAMMAIIMLAFMTNMYKKTKVNLMVYGISVVLFAFGLWGVRSQQTVDQVDWMQAMIPHHSIAILTSSRADIEDPRVRQLADDIIEAQKREIGEMQALIDELEWSQFRLRRNHNEWVNAWHDERLNDVWHGLGYDAYLFVIHPTIFRSTSTNNHGTAQVFAW